MTILDTLKEVCLGIGLDEPDQVYGSTVREYKELGRIANLMGKRIARAHEWQDLTALHTVTGDGTTTAHSLPSDYDRMPKDMQIWASDQETYLTGLQSHNKWLERDVRDFEFLVNAWILRGGQLHIDPALSTGVTAQFYYIQDTYATNAGGTRQSKFQADTDEFVLDDTLLELGIIWRWREMKGLPYAEDMADYERELSKRIAPDSGSRIIKVGAPRVGMSGNPAYPWAIDQS